MDYATAMNALLAGHLHMFFVHLPTNGAGGSIILRAPFAGMAKLTGGGQLALYRSGSFGCLLALGGLGLWLARDGLRDRHSPLVCLGLIAVYAGAPALLEAVYYGHPEEPLGAAFCVTAVILAGNDRPELAGLALGAAIINKPWGLLAVGPTLLCARAGWWRAALATSAVGTAWFASGILAAPGQFMRSVHGAETSLVAHPQELWWPLNHSDGLNPRPPAWLGAHARQLAVALAVTCAGVVAGRRHRGHQTTTVDSCLALLALGFGLRCLLEPATHDYYQLPFVVVLAAWELRCRGTTAVSVLILLLLAADFRRLNEYTPTLPYLVYIGLMVPLCFVLLADALDIARTTEGNLLHRGLRRQPKDSRATS